MRFFLSFSILICLSCPFVNAQQNSKSISVPVKRSPEIESLINEAFFLPNEFGANLIVKIEQSKLIKEGKWKKELLEKALNLSENVQNPVRKRLAVKGISVDNREVYVSKAYNQKLDKLSLQLSVVKEMLRIDKVRARQIFNEITLDKNLILSSCADALTIDLSDYYKTLTDIANTAFTDKEKKANMPVNFVENQLQTIYVNSQVGPIAKILPILKFTPQEKENLIIVFLNSLKTIQTDNRSFFVLITDDKVIDDFMALYKLTDSKQTQTLISVGFRGLIIKNLQAEKCSDYALQSNEIRFFVNFFNANFTSNSPIVLEEIAQDENISDQSLFLHNSVISQSYSELVNKYKDIRFVEDGDDNYRETNDLERNDIIWQNNASEFLTELEVWSGNDKDSDLDFLNEKSVLYKSLLNIVPDNCSLKSKVIQSYLSFLSKSNAYKTEKIGWFYWASDFIMNYPSGSFENSGNETLRVYRKFYKLNNQYHSNNQS
jgi:hypothetical protein